MAINLNIIKLHGLVRVLREIKQELVRMNELTELSLEQKDGIRAKVRKATEEELEDSKVEYSHPEYEALVERLERASGKELDEKGRDMIAQYLSEEDE